MNKNTMRIFSVLTLSLGLLSLLMIFMSEINSAEFYISVITFILDIVVFIVSVVLIRRKAGE